MKRALFLSILLIFLPAALWSDILYFKDGKIIEVESSRDDGSLIKGTQFGAEIGYPKDSIIKIDKKLTKAQVEEVKKKEIEEEIKRQETLIEAQKKKEIELKRKEAFANDNPLEPPPDCYMTIRKSLLSSLFDPYSMKDFQIESGPEKMVLLQDALNLGLYKGQFCWKCTASYNAKNRYGAYTGNGTHTYYIKNEHIIASD